MAAVASSTSSSTPPPEKDSATFCLGGHVDAGKATLVGHLLVLLRQADVAQYVEPSQAIGKASFKYAWIVGQRTASERERGITIDLHSATMETNRMRVKWQVPPSHRDFIRSFCKGVNQSDCLVLVVAAAQGEFEAGLSRHGQTREHALIAFALAGIRRALVVVNKMDTNSVIFSQERYQEIVDETGQVLTKIGYTSVQFVPVSAWAGDNMVVKSERLPWYNGPTLVEALESQAAQVSRDLASKQLHLKPARFLVSNVLYRPDQQQKATDGAVRVIVTGLVAQGVFRVGDAVTIAPHDRDPATWGATIASIEENHTRCESAGPGSIVGFAIAGLAPAAFRLMRSGVVLGHRKSYAPPDSAPAFVAQIIIMQHPGAAGLRIGYTPVMQIGSAQVSVTWTRFLHKLDRRTGAVTETCPAELRTGDAAVVEMVPTQPVCVECFSDAPALGRFFIRDLRTTVAIGIIMNVTLGPDAKWHRRKVCLLIRFCSRNRFRDAFSVWNIMVNTSHFLA